MDPALRIFIEAFLTVATAYVGVLAAQHARFLIYDISGDISRAVTGIRKLYAKELASESEEVRQGPYPNVRVKTSGLTDAEEKLCHDGLIINAIREVRTRTSLGLREAKDLVDNYRYDNPR